MKRPPPKTASEPCTMEIDVRTPSNSKGAKPCWKCRTMTPQPGRMDVDFLSCGSYQECQTYLKHVDKVKVKLWYRRRHTI